MGKNMKEKTISSGSDVIDICFKLHQVITHKQKKIKIQKGRIVLKNQKIWYYEHNENLKCIILSTCVIPDLHTFYWKCVHSEYSAFSKIHREQWCFRFAQITGVYTKLK